MRKLLSIIATALTIVSCGSQKQSGATAENGNQKAIVLYYSQCGTTKTVAEEIQKQTGADIEAIEAEVPYDGTYEETIERCKKEMANGDTIKIKQLKADLSQYDIIYLGYPVWFGTYAPPVATLVNTVNFDNKTIIPFCTFGSGGLEATTQDLKTTLPKTDIREGFGIRQARINAVSKEVMRFLIESNLIEGEVEKLSEYSAQKPVTKEETDIFNEACGDYKFPLGTPETVGSRTTSDGTDYKFSVKGKGPDGKESSSTIYVTVDKNTKKAEFTKVIR